MIKRFPHKKMVLPEDCRARPFDPIESAMGWGLAVVAGYFVVITVLIVLS